MSDIKQQSKKKNRFGERIAEQIMMQIGRNVLIVFLIIAVVTIFMMRSVLMTAKETELTLESKSMSNQLAEFFGTYISMTEQLAVNPQVREVLKDTGVGESINVPGSPAQRWEKQY